MKLPYVVNPYRAAALPFHAPSTELRVFSTKLKFHKGILRITMAAIDPSAPAKAVDGFPNAPERATLKIIRESISEDDDESDGKFCSGNFEQ